MSLNSHPFSPREAGVPTESAQDASGPPAGRAHAERTGLSVIVATVARALFVFGASAVDWVA
jgi:hypothetical protein